ncbi:MAG: hypothetical protein QM674_07860 [Burkholderiaceae bacterium]
MNDFTGGPVSVQAAGGTDGTVHVPVPPSAPPFSPSRFSPALPMIAQNGANLARCRPSIVKRMGAVMTESDGVIWVILAMVLIAHPLWIGIAILAARAGLRRLLPDQVGARWLGRYWDMPAGAVMAAQLIDHRSSRRAPARGDRPRHAGDAI